MLMSNGNLRILAGLAFGYLFPEESIEAGAALAPDAIVAQGTSSDVGPSYYGLGKPHFPRPNIKQALRAQLGLARRLDIPFVMSLGSVGADVHLDYVLQIVDEIAEEDGLRFRAAVISGEISAESLKADIDRGVEITRLAESPHLSEVLTHEDLSDAVRLVAQMGPEPIMAALDLDVDGVFVGRSLDSGLFMALPMQQGVDRGVAAHFGTIMACGALAAEPGSLDLLFGEIDREGFTVLPPNGQLVCTTQSVAAHSLYEQPNPGLEQLPGGTLDTRAAEYAQLDERAVRVTGSRWIERTPYTVKVEGVRRQGARTVCLAGVRDSLLIGELDAFLNRAKEIAEERLELQDSGVDIDFKVYGRDAVMGSWEPSPQPGHEVAVLVDVIAPSQEQASAVCGLIRSELLLGDYPKRTSTSGNVALPFSPSELELGDNFTFNVWHEWPLDDPSAPFPMTMREFGS